MIFRLKNRIFTALKQFNMFEDWSTRKRESISKFLLWEYDLDSPGWDWDYMKRTVVERVIERGNINDYYAMLQQYGGFENVREIVKQIPKLSPMDMNWVCVLFKLKKEELQCYTRNQLRAERLKY